MGLAPTDRARLVRIPRPLSAAQKNARLVAFRVAPAEEPVKLSARENVRDDSRVEFYSPHEVRGIPDIVLFGAYDANEDRRFMQPPHENARADIVFKFANRADAHLIDVCVSAMPNGPQATFTLSGAVNETRTVGAGLQHLTSLLPANSGKSAGITVSCNEAWSFYFAELTIIA